MVVGVNGAGKTTTIAKLAYQFKMPEKKYSWCCGYFQGCSNRSAADLGRQGRGSLIKQQMGSDPASVAYDTVKSAVAGK